MIVLNPNISQSELMAFLFKYRGTNCSAVAKELGMPRQALYRMIKSDTLKIDMFLKILKVLEMQISVSEDKSECTMLKDFSGPRFKKKLNGVLYDTDKLFSIAESGYNDHVKAELCLEPVTQTLLIAHYCEDGFEKKKYPYFEIVKKERAEEFINENKAVSANN